MIAGAVSSTTASRAARIPFPAISLTSVFVSGIAHVGTRAIFNDATRIVFPEPFDSVGTGARFFHAPTHPSSIRIAGLFPGRAGIRLALRVQRRGQHEQKEHSDHGFVPLQLEPYVCPTSDNRRLSFRPPRRGHPK